MTARDKRNQEIKPGGHVTAVHFGEHHTFQVEKTSEEHGHHLVHGKVAIKVPAVAVTVVDKQAEHESAPKHEEQRHEHRPSPKPTAKGNKD